MDKMEFYLSQRKGKVMAFQEHENIFVRKINDIVHGRCGHYKKLKYHSKIKSTGYSLEPT